jgi:ParB/RepB/Spo0J family partition protein
MRFDVPKVEMVSVELIEVSHGRRSVDPDSVSKLAASMSSIGLRTPITVRYFADRQSACGTDDSFILIAGRHRLEAAKSLGWEEIPCFSLTDEPDDQARLWEIAENLHRADLTALERAENIAEWIRLADKVQSAQVAQNESKRADGRGHRAEGGVSSAAREIGVERTTAERSKTIAALSDEAKEAARDVGLGDNQTALLAVARAPGSAVDTVLPGTRTARNANTHGFVINSQIRDMLSKRLSGSGFSVPRSLNNII